MVPLMIFPKRKSSVLCSEEKLRFRESQGFQDGWCTPGLGNEVSMEQEILVSLDLSFHIHFCSCGPRPQYWVYSVNASWIPLGATVTGANNGRGGSGHLGGVRDNIWWMVSGSGATFYEDRRKEPSLLTWGREMWQHPRGIPSGREARRFDLCGPQM